MNCTDLRHYIRVYDNALDVEFCTQMISSFSGLSRFHKINGRGVRTGLEESAWTELNVSQLADERFKHEFTLRIEQSLARYNQDVGLAIAIPPTASTADLIMKRYQPAKAEQFQLHFDSIYHKSNRYLVYLWYLNDVVVGGETHFPQLNYTVAPKKGRLLMFPPYWMYQHEGLPPQSTDKYIVSTYLLFTNT
jgi:prolyl 4-hydroxylase